MDPALLREREAFKKRAMAVPTVEKRKNRDEGSSKPPKKHRSQPKPKSSSSGGSSSFDYKTMAGSSQYKFAILAKIVKYMKQRHQQGDCHPLTIDDILDETNQLDVGASLRHWLVTEALMNNPKIEVVDGSTFKFKPKYNVRDRKGLMRLLDKHDTKGLGGILQEDIEESLPHAQKAFKVLEDRIIFVTRSNDKKVVLFYNDKSYQFSVDEELQKLWRGAAVDGMDEGKIEEYLEKQGITSMQDSGTRKAPIPKRKKASNKKKKGTFKSHNEHISDILEDYSNKK